MSSLDSTTSEESAGVACVTPGSHGFYGSVSSLLSGHAGSGANLKDHYGSISSLASSTSLISPQVREENVFVIGMFPLLIDGTSVLHSGGRGFKRVA
jgi:hypothetical protein